MSATLLRSEQLTLAFSWGFNGELGQLKTYPEVCLIVLCKESVDECGQGLCLSSTNVHRIGAKLLLEPCFAKEVNQMWDYTRVEAQHMGACACHGLQNGLDLTLWPDSEAPVACSLSAWQSWDRCSAQCGGGSRIRKRVVQQPAKNGGDECTALQERGTCNAHECGESPVPCVVGPWDVFGDCDRDCGGGKMTRSAGLQQPPVPQRLTRWGFQVS